MRLWKALGLAGLAGVAATGAIIARDQRQRAQLTPEEVRARLRRRLEEAGAGASADLGARADLAAPAAPEEPAQPGSTESSARA
jgi:hypothetical protein